MAKIIDLTIRLTCVAIDEDAETISADPLDDDTLDDFANLVADCIATDEVMRVICEGSDVFAVATRSEFIGFTHVEAEG